MRRRTVRASKPAPARGKTGRLEARLTEARKELLQRAADVRGQTLTERYRARFGE